MSGMLIQIDIDPACVYPGYEVVRFGFPEPGESYMEFTGQQALVSDAPLRWGNPRLIVRRSDKPFNPVQFQYEPNPLVHLEKVAAEAMGIRKT